MENKIKHFLMEKDGVFFIPFKIVCSEAEKEGRALGVRMFLSRDAKLNDPQTCLLSDKSNLHTIKYAITF